MSTFCVDCHVATVSQCCPPNRRYFDRIHGKITKFTTQCIILHPLSRLRIDIAKKHKRSLSGLLFVEFLTILRERFVLFCSFYPIFWGKIRSKFHLCCQLSLKPEGGTYQNIYVLETQWAIDSEKPKTSLCPSPDFSKSALVNRPSTIWKKGEKWSKWSRFHLRYITSFHIIALEP